MRNVRNALSISEHSKILRIFDEPPCSKIIMRIIPPVFDWWFLTCGNKMEKGLMVTPGAVEGVRWRKGEPNNWVGTIVVSKPKIITYSYTKCGFVESYVEKKKQ